MNLQEFTNRCEKPSLKNWVNSVVHNAISREGNQITYQDVEHVLDFLHSDQAPRGIKNLSWKQAKEKATAWIEMLNKRAFNAIETEEDIEIVFPVPGMEGYKWVKLIGKSAYEREGRLMSHCIASFYNKEDSENYSLRDGKNNPHASLEIRRSANQIVQVKGKGNGPIHPKYIKAVLEFHKHLGMPIRPHDLPNLGYVFLSESLVHAIETLYPPEEIKYLTVENKKYFYIYSFKE